MNNIKKKVITTISFTSAIILVLIILSVIFLGCGGEQKPIQTAITLMGNYVGAITTLAAAYIAFLIYGGWKKVEDFKEIQNLHNEAVVALLICSKELNRILGQLKIIEIEKDKAKSSNQKISEEKKNTLGRSLSETSKDVFINVQDTTFNICVKIAMGYTRPLNNDPDLKFMFDILNDTKDFIQKIALDKGNNDKKIAEITKFINDFNTKIDIEMNKRNLN